MKKLLFCALLAFAPATLASADLKVATVDLSKAFDAFYKTKETDAHLKEKQAEASKELQDKVADYQRIGEEVQGLEKASKDATLAPSAQADKQKAFNQRAADLQAAGRQIEEFKAERTNELKDEYMRRHKEIVDQISKVVKDYSGPQGFDLVIDSSSVSVTSGASLVLYNSNKLTDITDEVIKLLNANAPAAAPGGAATTAPGTEELPPPPPSVSTH